MALYKCCINIIKITDPVAYGNLLRNTLDKSIQYQAFNDKKELSKLVNFVKLARLFDHLKNLSQQWIMQEKPIN